MYMLQFFDEGGSTISGYSTAYWLYLLGRIWAQDVFCPFAQASHDGKDVFFMLQVDGDYTYSEGYGFFKC